MSKELTTIDYNSKEVVDTLIATVAQGLNKQEFSLFAEHCKSTGLNPFKKEVWAIKASGRLQLMTGINGYFTIANRHPEFDGYEEGFVGKDGQELPDTYQGSDYIGAWCRVHRKDRKIPAKGVAFKNEYEKTYGNWKTMPKSMLLKCAESIALRKAFPQELNGTYTAEEMPVEYSQTVEVVQPKPILQTLKSADVLQQEQAAKVFGDDDIEPAPKKPSSGLYHYDLKSYFADTSMTPAKANKVMRKLEDKQGIDMGNDFWAVPEYIEGLKDFIVSDEVAAA